MDGLHRGLLSAVVALAVATAVGVVALWPSGDAVPEPVLSQVELRTGTIVEIEEYQGEPDPFTGADGASALIDVRLDDGAAAGSVVVVDTGLDGFPPLEPGDRVRMVANDVGEAEPSWAIVDVVRGPALLALGIVFAVAVVAVGGWQGLRSLVGLAWSLAVIVAFVVPAIVDGASPLLVAAVGGSAVVLVTLYLSHGVDVKTTTAALGTAGALVVTVLVGSLFVDAAGLTGFASEEAGLVAVTLEGVDLRGLVLAGLVIAALGVLDDVTVVQASTVLALRGALPDAGTAEMFRRAMVVGRDHIASTVNTLVLAYVGASLALLLVLTTSGRPAGEALQGEVIAEELVKILVGSLGIVTAVPLTTLLAAWVASRTTGPVDAGGGHAHGPLPDVDAG